MKRPIDTTPFNFVFYDPKAYEHPWMPKYKYGTMAVSSLLDNPGDWVVGPGFVCGQEEKFRPAADQAAGIIMQLENYYKNLSEVPEPIKAQQLANWKALPKEQLVPQARDFFTKIAIKRREEAKGTPPEEIARMLGVK